MGKSLNYPLLIKEEEEELLLLLRKESFGINRDRLRFLLSLKNGSSKSQSAAAELIGLGGRQGQNIWRKYREGGVEGLLERISGAAPCKLTREQLLELEERLKDDDIQFLHESVSYIKKKYGESYTESGIHYMFKRLKIKKKTGRPVNIRQDTEGLGDFKKTSERS